MTVVTAAARDSQRMRGDSRHARSLFSDLMAVAPDVRRRFVVGLSEADLTQVLAVARAEGGTEFALYVDDPVGFVEDVLGETLWSKQETVLRAVPGHTRIAVPAAFSVGKTWLAARIVVWYCLVYPVGTATAVTTATRFRQVRHQLWPHIRRTVTRSGLPGEVDTTQWKQVDPHGVETAVAYGFTAPEYDEEAVSGIHAAHVLLVVDEAGGIGHTIGRSTRNLLTGDAHMLAIGNPPTDDEGSWFETLCEDGDDPAVPDTVTVRIAAADSPAISGENAGRCRDCPPQVPAHPLSTHLVDPTWVAGAVRDHGGNAPYVTAKVHARFPKGSAFQAVPYSWVEAAVDAPDPRGDEYVRLRDLGLDSERDDATVGYGSWIRLGVDVAADGGDEFVIARGVGDLVHIRHMSSGSVNAHPHTVAGRVLEEIRAAEQLRTALGSRSRVRVKIDAIGVGWGVAGILRAWGSEGMHRAEIVPVVVSEKTNREPDSATLHPYRQRDEMWLAVRALLSPPVDGGPGRLRLRVDGRTQAQLSAPRYDTNYQGFTVIESKKSLRERGLSSPDRAEAVLLTVFEPPGRKRARLVV